MRRAAATLIALVGCAGAGAGTGAATATATETETAEPRSYQEIIANDREAAKSPHCAVAGCALGHLYKICQPAAEQPPPS